MPETRPFTVTPEASKSNASGFAYEEKRCPGTPDSIACVQGEWGDWSGCKGKSGGFDVDALASMPPPPNLTGHSTENQQQGQYPYVPVLVSTPAPVQMGPQMVQQTAQQTVQQTVPQTAVPMPMNFPVPGTGPTGWQQVATSGSEWRDLRRRWGSEQDMNGTEGVDGDKVEVSADELRSLRKELKELRDVLEEQNHAKRGHTTDSSGMEAVANRHGTTGDRMFFEDAKGKGSKRGRAPEEPRSHGATGDDASGWFCARTTPFRLQRGRGDKNQTGSVSSAAERPWNSEGKAWASSEWRGDRQKGRAPADWREDNKAWASGGDWREDNKAWASADWREDNKAWGDWREDKKWASGGERREYRPKARAPPADRKEKPWGSAGRREDRLEDHQGPKGRNRQPGRKPAPAQKSVRIRIDGLYGLHKNEVMTVEDADDCDGTIIILSGCWKFFAVPKGDEGVGWEYVDSPPTCINPGNCAKHRGMKYSLITDFEDSDDPCCRPCPTEE